MTRIDLRRKRKEIALKGSPLLEIFRGMMTKFMLLRLNYYTMHFFLFRDLSPIVSASLQNVIWLSMFRISDCL